MNSKQTIFPKVMQASLLFSLSFTSVMATPSNGANGLLNCDNLIDLNQYKGSTYFDFMDKTVKPLLDQYATEGYSIKSGEEIERALVNVSKKVKSKAIDSVGGEKSNLIDLANQLAGQTATLYTLPSMIAEVNPRYDRFTLSTFLGLASCGGAIIKYADGNIAYNVHYGTGENPKDNRTGRSFGEGPTRSAEDASDKNYLMDLEEFVTEHEKSIDDFYSTLVKALANNDTSDYPKISDFGQTLLTDFLAVYTAEQARNLMDGEITLHWDAALLEVTLLGAFHAGQEKVQLYFKSPTDNSVSFTNQVFHQGPGGSERTRVRQAALYDYWQFSTNPDPEHRNRSGINITKDEFRKLGEKISDYERQNNPELVKSVEKHFYFTNRGGNVFKELSRFFINTRTKRQLGSEADELAADYTRFLMQVKQDAKLITESIVKGEL